MEKILTADFSNGASQIRLRGIWQHDYGSKLKVKGIDYSTLIRVDFAGANDPKAYPVVAVQETDGTFTAKIPKEVTDQAYDINAYIYVSGNDAGYTVKQVVMPVQERVEADPASGGGTATDPYADVIEKMKEYKIAAEGAERNATSSAEKAAEAAKSAGESEKKATTAAGKAAESATSASHSAETAGQKAIAAETAASNAAESATAAEKSATAAGASATAAKESETAATASAVTATEQAEKIKASAEQIEKNKTDVASLKGDLSNLIQIIKGTYEKANTQNIKFPFIVGHEYEVRNTSESSAMEATAYDGNLQSVEKIGTINAGESLKYAPSSNAAYLHFYMNGPGSFECEDITLKIPFLQQGLKDVEAKISDVENPVLKELPELIITPALRNGSVPNLVNKNAIATLKTIPTNGCEKVIVKTSLKPQDGYYFYWAGAKYKNTGTDSSDNTGRAIVDPWSTEITNFEIDVSDCASFAISLTEKSKENPEILHPHRVELDGNAFTFVYCYGLNEISSRLKKVEESVVADDSTLSLDYSSLIQSMNGKVNFAVQADTHMSCYTNYRIDGNVFYANDFLAFEKVLRSIKKLECDAVIHLGDIVRGYEFDMDYETRESIDTIVKLYSKNFENMFFVIGNHDDGNMFYRRTEYNDHQSNENVLYPYEQFNRITKFGVTAKNNKNYYYLDINGIRVITLYQRDFDYKDNIPGTESFEIGVEQIEWFRTDALNTTNPVIVLTHVPLASTLYENSGTGFSEVLTALQSFKTDGGTVIAVLSGHTHKQDYASVDNINHIVFDNGGTFFELVSVDLISKTVSCKPINNTSLQNRTYQYD